MFIVAMLDKNGKLCNDFHRLFVWSPEHCYSRALWALADVVMIVGLGIDLVELGRIRRSLERFGVHFIQKLLHSSEQAFLPLPDTARMEERLTSPEMVSFIAGRFAAKEAGAKALGTGFSGGIGLHDVRIHALASGQPMVSFYGRAKEVAAALGIGSTHLSLSHARETAGAVVVLEAGVPPDIPV